MINGAIEKGTYRVVPALSGLTASGESEEIVIAGAKRVTLAFTRADHSAGSSEFKVQVSLDGETYVDYNKLIDNVTNTNAQTLTRVASASLASDTTKVYSMDLDHDCYYAMKVVVTETTDGTHTAQALIEY